MNTTHHRPQPAPVLDPALVSVVALAVGVLGAHWLGANLAAFVTHRRWPISPVDSVLALGPIRRHFGSPKLAYPASIQADLAGPVTYWACVVVVLLAAAVAAIAIGSWIAGSRSEAVNRRSRLGVPTQPSMATPKDLKPLYVRRPVPDRLLLLPYKRGWLATEGARRSRRDRGIQGGVALIGPSQSGKTTALIQSIRHWSGPAVVCSVKTDLMRSTIDAARARGEVHVFDPLGLSREPSVRWSPLRSANTLDGASSAASLLIHAAGNGSSNDKFWRGQAEQLLTAMLWAAANLDGHTMANVVAWVMNLDIPDDAGRGTLAPLVRVLRDNPDPQVAAEAAEVDGWLWGQWKTDSRTTSGVYATTRDAIWPWPKPRVRASAEGCDIDLAWLTSGSNTLYLCAPLGDEKLGVVFSAVLQDLIGQAFQRANYDDALSPRLLMCIDETANTPLPKLAEWASTLTGTGTQLVTVWQSRAQLDQIYGHHADTVLTNHRTKIVFPSGLHDPITAAYISTLVGDEYVRSEIDEHRPFGAPGSRQRDDRIPASSTPFLPPHVLRATRPGSALILHGDLRPAWIPA